MSYRGPSPWADGVLDARLAELVAEKRSAKEIGEVLGVSRCAVIGRTHRTGLHLNPPRSGNPRPTKRGDGWKRPSTVPLPPKLRPPPMPVPVCDAPEAGTVALLDLRQHHCRWPFGDGPFTFCGAMRSWPGPYCPAHQRLGTT